MFPAGQFRELLVKWVWILPCAVLALMLPLYRSALNLPRASQDSPPDSTVKPRWAPALSAKEVDWMIVRSRNGDMAGKMGRLSKRFRLAGSFLLSGTPTGDIRKAVLADLQKDTQEIVSEHDFLEDVEIVKIFPNRVILRDKKGEEELWLSFTTRGGATDGKAPLASQQNAAAGAHAARGDRFGQRRVGVNSRVIRRDSIMRYYNDLLDNPERLLAVFDSMKPLYTESGRIEGYRLNIEGEADFFGAMGLNEGDVVRRVNSTPMRSRRIAEAFIREFSEGRASAFVIEVDRDGRQEKLIYQVR